MLGQQKKLSVPAEKSNSNFHSILFLKEVIEKFKYKIQAIKTDNTEETHQVTNVVNVLREDKVDKNRMLSQEEALANAKETHDGYFLVEAILD